MDALTILYSVLLAVAGTAALIIIPNLFGKNIERRLWQRFAHLNCPDCKVAFGIDAIQSGEDVSPTEELWEDNNGRTTGLQPTCRKVVCPGCGRNWVLRHQNRGANFGPELEVVADSRLGWRVPSDTSK